jgi:integrase
VRPSGRSRGGPRGDQASRRTPYRWWDGTVYRQATFPTKADKDDFIAEIRRRRRLGLPLRFEPADAPVRLDEFIEDYWRMHAVPNLEASTRANYLQQWSKWILPRLGPVRARADHAARRQPPARRADAPRRRRRRDRPRRARGAAVDPRARRRRGARRANPVDKVKKPPATVERQVPPIAPERIELLRASFDARNATIITLLGYQGLRPEELLALRAEDLAEGGIEVRRKVVDGQVRPYTKTRRNRFVKWTAPVVRRDVLAYQLAAGIRTGLLFARADGAAWRKHDYDNWRERVYQPAARAVGLPDPRPYDLRGSFVSLLAWEGHTMLEVARRAGHSLQTCDRHYAGIFEDASMRDRVGAEQRSPARASASCTASSTRPRRAMSTAEPRGAEALVRPGQYSERRARRRRRPVQGASASASWRSTVIHARAGVASCARSPEVHFLCAGEYDIIDPSGAEVRVELLVTPAGEVWSEEGLPLAENAAPVALASTSCARSDSRRRRWS